MVFSPFPGIFLEIPCALEKAKTGAHPGSPFQPVENPLECGSLVPLWISLDFWDLPTTASAAGKRNPKRKIESGTRLPHSKGTLPASLLSSVFFVILLALRGEHTLPNTCLRGERSAQVAGPMSMAKRFPLSRRLKKVNERLQSFAANRGEVMDGQGSPLELERECLLRNLNQTGRRRLCHTSKLTRHLVTNATKRSWTACWKKLSDQRNPVPCVKCKRSNRLVCDMPDRRFRSVPSPLNSYNPSLVVDSKDGQQAPTCSKCLVRSRKPFGTIRVHMIACWFFGGV